MKLRVLTFNTWGVPFFSRDRAARMRAIGRALAGMDVDVVGLQEVFYEKDRRLIARAAAEGGLLYSHYFQSGLMGSGLLTLSRYPIERNQLPAIPAQRPAAGSHPHATTTRARAWAGSAC